MVSFNFVILAATAIVGVFALPKDFNAGAEKLVQRSTPNQQGNNNGYFYQFCKH
jgi:hypothetical protein